MQTQLISMSWSVLAVLAGGLIGASFGKFQIKAARRNQQLSEAGQLKPGLATMPGSMRRTAYLLVCLALIQVLCPLLFTKGYEWWVSGGVVASYCAVLYIQLRRRLANLQ